MIAPRAVFSARRLGRSRFARTAFASLALGDYVAQGDFSAQAVGTASDLYGWTFSRASGASTYSTLAGTVVLGIAVDAGRIAAQSAGLAGLLIEPSRTNYVLKASDLTGSGWTAGTAATETANATTAPDGTVTAHRSAGASGTFGKYWSKAVASAVNSRWVSSLWIKDNGGGRPSLVSAIFAQTATIYPAPVASWKRHTHRSAANDSGIAGSNYIFCDGRNCLGIGGGAAAAFDVYRWGHQAEIGPYATSLIATTGASATRAADRLSRSTTSALTAGRKLRIYSRFTALAAETDYSEPGATAERFLVQDTTGFYKIWAESGKIYAQAYADDVSTFASVYTTSGSLSWAAGDLVELWVSMGGGVSPVIEWRINGGAIVTPTLSHPARHLRIQASGPFVIGATLHALTGNAGAKGLPGIHHELSLFKDGKAPAGFTP